jgi:multidrug efflux pump subunit AcrA (membrane-fusion protein)
MKRARWVAASILVLAAVAAVLTVTDPFRGPAKAAGNSYPVSTAPVSRQSLTSQTNVDGTVGRSGSYTLVNQSAGEYTELPAAGQVVRQGHVLYRVSGNPVVLLDGTLPSYRSLSVGMTGADVAELNHDLVTLGYADKAEVTEFGWDYFGWDTQYGVELLQRHLGLEPTGTLTLGQAVFAPAPIKVTSLAGAVVPGEPATPGQALVTASSTIPVVTIALDTGLQTYVKDGAEVTVDLPDGTATAGTISQIGTAVSSSTTSPSAGSGEPGSSSSSSAAGGSSSGQVTIPVQVTLTDPRAAAGLDQAPVSVTITTGRVSGVLVVPVDALLAQPGGGYAVEVTGPGGHHLVRVTPGLFDDAAGLVQVTGTGLDAGQRVVVPGT